MNFEAPKPSERRRARQLAMQALYQWDMNHTPAIDLIQQFSTSHNMQKVDCTYFEALVTGVTAHVADLDQLIRPQLDRDLETLNPVERAILRLSTEEFQHHPDVPFKVVINEAIELAKKYGADQGHKYVNGVLDRLAPILRPVEAASRK